MQRLFRCPEGSSRRAKRWHGKGRRYGENLHLAHRIADVLPSVRVLPGRFNVVQMAVGVRKRAAAALPMIDEFVNRTRSDGTVQKAIAEAGLRCVRVS
jgi:polar amino acid transport system substrate-binding protein